MTSQKIVDAALALIETARQSSADDALALPEGARLMVMARKLCHDDGHDPDVVVMGIPGQEITIAAKKLPTIYAPIVPAWCLYWDEAVRALKLVRDTEAANEGQDAA